MEIQLGAYIACICEGSAEQAIIDNLLDNHLLIFEREQIIDDDDDDNSDDREKWQWRFFIITGIYFILYRVRGRCRNRLHAFSLR